MNGSRVVECFRLKTIDLGPIAPLLSYNSTHKAASTGQ